MNFARLRRLDRRALALAGAIAAFGLVLVWSATSHGADGSARGQALRLAAAAVALVAGAVAPPASMRRHAYALYGLALLALFGVLVVGRATNEARRWFDLPGGFKVQPSEFAKIALLLALAKYGSRRARLRSLEGLVIPIVLAALPAALVVVEPDLGTALLFGPLLFGMLYAGGARRSHLALLFLVGATLAPIGGWFAMRPYQRDRIAAWWRQDRLRPEERRGAGYHLFHSKVSIGSGGILGKGIGDGPENRLDLLPERANDFVFAVAAEETGFLGAGALLGLWGALVFVLLSLASGLREPFDRLTVVGVAMLFGTHLVLHVGVTLGLVPTTGLTLPLVSYGGSSTVAAGLALGLALNAAARREPALSADAFE